MKVGFQEIKSSKGERAFAVYHTRAIGCAMRIGVLALRSFATDFLNT
jgi:hypothetical protein